MYTIDQDLGNLGYIDINNTRYFYISDLDFGCQFKM